MLNKVTRKVEITSHNHGFAVDPDSLNSNEIEITHINLNDQTLEGFRHRKSSRCSACNIIRRRRPARTIRTICSTISSKLMDAEGK